jgi:hypothetical protein
MAAELMMVAERRRPDSAGSWGDPRSPRRLPDEQAPAAISLHQFVRDETGQACEISRPVPVAERPPAAKFRSDG